MSEIIFLSNVRLSFPHLAEPQKQVNEQTGKEETVIKIETLPLDMDAVQVTLWPLPFAIAAPEKQETTADKTAETVEEEA